MLPSEWYLRMYEASNDKNHPTAQMFKARFETLRANESWWELIKQDYENIVEYWTNQFVYCKHVLLPNVVEFCKSHIVNTLVKLFFYE